MMQELTLKDEDYRIKWSFIEVICTAQLLYRVKSQAWHLLDRGPHCNFGSS